MSGIKFSGNSGGRTVFTVLENDTSIANFGFPFNTILSIILPEYQADRVILRGQLFFSLNVGGLDLAISSNGFFNGDLYCNSVAGGNVIYTDQVPNTYFFPGASFDGITNINFYYAVIPTFPGQLNFSFGARENSAAVPGKAFAGSYIEVIPY